ncbi:hypothetical protein C8A01DRAFT_15487 [Parachaetomium inaequale]|uniref:Uncharacterized protein n=1 Tax=Parachaetomium inaequale TaxID=2588326 RepID=A0AAN6PGP8_9PEZI|nr:hypothetical protein C8A01DRAFT_15487 [Parachaetomium inaequale]
MGAPKQDNPPLLPPAHPPATTTTNATTPADAPPPYEPPAYELRPETAAPDPDELLDPSVLVIHGRFIYPVNPSGEADSEPAYQLSRAIHMQGTATEKMAFQRLDLRVRTIAAADGDVPSVSRRAKDVYELEHRKARPHLGFPFEAWLEPQTRKALGKVKIEKSPAFRSGFRAVKVVSEAEERYWERQGKKAKKGEYYFVVKEGSERDWEWSDVGGRVVASQVRERVAVEGGAEEVFKLKVLVPLSRRERDTLVALWCLWMWHIHVEEGIPKRTWGDRKRIMQMPRLYPGLEPGSK